MTPEDLKNPKGLESKQNEQKLSESTAANDEIKPHSPDKKAEFEDQGESPASAGNSNEDTSESDKGSESKPDISGSSKIEDMPKSPGEGKAEESLKNPEIQQEAVDASEEKVEEFKQNAEAVTQEDSSKKPDSPANGDKAEVPASENLESTQNTTEDSKKKDEVVNEAQPDDSEIIQKASPKKDSKDNNPKKEEEKVDYAHLSLIELINELTAVLDNKGDHDIKDEVEDIKTAFYKKVAEEAEEQKKQYIEEGGTEEEFQEQENPYEQDMKDLLKRYRQVRHDHNKKLEQEKEGNLQLKYDIIEEIKGLIHKEESINKTFQDFRELQQRWREIGPVPQSNMKDLWDLYHFHVENFYDYIKINQELRDLDLKKNLEIKIRLCEQAEELLLETNTIKAFNNLQKLHDRWREVGPVPRDNRDDIWERFKAATAKINKKYQEFFEIRKQEQKKNLEAKSALCDKVEEISEMELETHKEWSEKAKEVVNLQKVWRTIGFAPKKDNNRIYTRFREACDKFFNAKRDFYAKNKQLQQSNLQMKIDLCEQAESLKDSTDWQKTTQELINIQKQWKEIGPVPRKHSDVLWKRFRSACDHFFEKKSDHFSGVDEQQVENLNLKLALINEVENFKSTDNVDEKLNQLKDFQRRWTEIGHVPIKKKDEVQKRFRESINKLFDELKLDDSKRNLLKFRSKIVSISETSRGQNKMRLERDKYMSKLKQLENDLVLLDNNIGFFTKSKNAESLIEDVQRKIEQTKEKIEFLKNKIRVIDEMDTTED